MKNKQKTTQSKKSDTEINKKRSDQSTKKKPTLNSLLQKSSQIISNYNSTFKKTINHYGDADTYFKHILRNYEACGDFVKTTVDCQILKAVDSVEFIKGKKSIQHVSNLRTKKKSQSVTLISPHSKEKTVIREIFVRPPSEPISQDEAYLSPAGQSDLFLSPKSDEQFTARSGNEDLTTNLEGIYLEGQLEEPEQQQQTEDNQEALSSIREDIGEVEILEEFKENKNIEEEVTQLPEDIESSKMAEEEVTENVTTEETTFATTDITDTEVTDVGEEDDMKEVEKMIEQATNELDQVAEENRQIMEALEESVKGASAGGEGSIFKFDPAIDNAVMKELEEAEKQAKETAKIICELKKQVAELCKTEKMTEAEAKELEEKNKALKKQMILFEEKTKRILFLLAQGNLFDNLLLPGGGGAGSVPQEKRKEDMLPKVICCGVTENNMPKIIVCENKQYKSRKSSPDGPCGTPQNVCPNAPRREEQQTCPPCQPPMGGLANMMGNEATVPQFARKLNQSYTMQERLAQENATLESTRYKLQSDLLNKDQTVESLQRKVTCLQNEMRMVCKENCLLSEKLNKIQVSKHKSQQKCDCGDVATEMRRESEQCKKEKMGCGKGRGTCPADVETRLMEYSETTTQLEQQLMNMESEVKYMQNELIAVQKEREHLEHHRKMLCGPPCPTPPCCGPPCQPPCPSARGSADQQLRELREQYCRLQDDFKGKVTEVAGLRADNEKLKELTSEAEEARKNMEQKLKEVERELKILKAEKNKFTGSKEQLVEQEQQLAVAKQRFREAQDELEELRALIQDQQGQMDDYRNKYLEAQQMVEEQKRQIDLMELENNRVSEQVNLEIQRVKNQFQEKLQELTPLPDILKSTQLKLQEAQQMHILAERNNEAMAKDLQVYKEKLAAIIDEMDRVRSDQQLGADAKAGLNSKLEQCEQKCEELGDENLKLTEQVVKLEEMVDEAEMKHQEKLHEIAQLASQLESVREESARQVSRTKDRCETVRRSMQNQISDLERQLAQSRAQARSAQKDRDEIRQKMQAQINNLNENFEDAQMRIRNLQGHVNFLKHSYTNVFAGNGEQNVAVLETVDPCNCGQNY